MKKYNIVIFIFFIVISCFLTAQAVACMKAYGKTAKEALQAGFDLAERDGEESKKNGILAPYVRVKIMLEKENGLFVAEVHSSNFCVLEFKNDGLDDDIIPEIRNCRPKKKSFSGAVRSAAVAVHGDGT